MQRLFISLLVFTALSCKKNTQEDAGLALGETNWNLHFKNNSTFNNYAESQLFFKADKNVQNYRNFDTISGTWKSTASNVTITFDNGDIYNGTAITSDSISGTLTASGNNGVWYATRR